MFQNKKMMYYFRLGLHITLMITWLRTMAFYMLYTVSACLSLQGYTSKTSKKRTLIFAF